MDALEFLRTYGKAEAERVALAAETNFAYFSQIAHGHRRPSVDLAERLVESSDRRLDFRALLLAKRPARSERPITADHVERAIGQEAISRTA